MRKHFSSKMLLSYAKLPKQGMFDFDGMCTYWYTITFVKYSWWGLFTKTVTQETYTNAQSWNYIQTKLDKKLNKWIK